MKLDFNYHFELDAKFVSTVVALIIAIALSIYFIPPHKIEPFIKLITPITKHI